MPNTLFKKINLWDAMIDFDQSNREGVIAFYVGGLFGWLYHLFLLDFTSWSWAFIIRGAEGVIFAVFSGLAVKVSTDFYTIKIKNKIFKNGKKRKSKPETEADEAA